MNGEVIYVHVRHIIQGDIIRHLSTNLAIVMSIGQMSDDAWVFDMFLYDMHMSKIVHQKFRGGRVILVKRSWMPR